MNYHPAQGSISYSKTRVTSKICMTTYEHDKDTQWFEFSIINLRIQYYKYQHENVHMLNGA